MQPDFNCKLFTETRFYVTKKGVKMPDTVVSIQGGIFFSPPLATDPLVHFQSVKFRNTDCVQLHFEFELCFPYITGTVGYVVIHFVIEVINDHCRQNIVFSKNFHHQK